MSLAALIKKGSLRGFATATPATSATDCPCITPTVATVTVATAPDRAANDPGKAGTFANSGPSIEAANSASEADYLIKIERPRVQAVKSPAKTCTKCQHFGPRKTCFEPVAAGLADRFCIHWPDPQHAASCPAFTDKLETQA